MKSAQPLDTFSVTSICCVEIPASTGVRLRHSSDRTLEELAEVTGVNALSAFRSFKRHRGYSPTVFLSQAQSRSKTTLG